MIRSILIGIAAGQRAMSPLAAVAGAARRGALPDGAFAKGLLENPVVASGAVAMAAAEMAGDKMKTAPDRIVPAGLIARTVTGGFAGAVLARPGERKLAALIAASTAIATSYVGWSIRMRAMKRFGQTGTGFVEDALVFGGAWAAANARGVRI